MTTAPLGFALHALGRAHRARLAALLSPHGIHPGQDLLLLAVWDHPGLRPSALAGQLGVEAPTVTRMVQRMERGGLIERRPDPHDARATLLHPTPRSRLLESTVRRAWAELDEVMTQRMGETAAQRLRDLAAAATKAIGA